MSQFIPLFIACAISLFMAFRAAQKYYYQWQFNRLIQGAIDGELESEETSIVRAGSPGSRQVDIPTPYGPLHVWCDTDKAYGDLCKVRDWASRASRRL